MKEYLFFTILLITVAGSTFAQTKLKNPAVYVDNKGIMRWSDTKQEASFYGVNYTAPFSTAYWALGYLNADRKAAIDKDVYHFARLGFNAYRIHVWDIEISDKKGNLVYNDHLDLFDYLVAKLGEHGIFIILTPMCRNGSITTPDGFSQGRSKCESYLDEDLIRAQANYIYNFAKHVNPYTGLSYNDDPHIIGYEIDNEPLNRPCEITSGQIKYFINTMLGAFEKADNKKPVFYNVTHKLQQIQTFYDTPVQGTTFQWYPTGLTAGFERKGNFLPNADVYQITFKNVRNYDKKAKIVYEYDIPDVLQTYMYPAVTRSFREQNMQWISMFAYDPMDIAFTNVEYFTHFMNLAYTPGKALSMKIAAEVTRVMPMGKNYGQYPQDTIFESFRLSYLEDLAEMNTDNKFFYTNNTSTSPKQITNLKEIAGRGNSPVVKYKGTGAYFIDKLEDGVWRLEVMPDVLWIRDPAERPSILKEVATIAWNTLPMEIILPDLGSSYSFVGINSGNNARGIATYNTINVFPGIYILNRSGVTPKNNWTAETKWGFIRLGDYAAPTPRAKVYHLVHQPATTIVENSPLNIKASVAGPALPDSVVLFITAGRILRHTMKYTGGLDYFGTIPAEHINGLMLKYSIVIYRDGNPYTFPANVDLAPNHRDYYWAECFESPIVSGNSPIRLLTIDGKLNRDLEIIPIPYDSDNNDRGIIKQVADVSPAEAPRLKIILEEKNGQDVNFYARRFIKQEIAPRRNRLDNVSNLCFVLKNPEGFAKFNIGFVSNMGFTYTTSVNINGSETTYKVPVSHFIQAHTALLPETYPIFMKRYFTPDVNIPFRVQDIESIELSIGELNRSKVSLELGAIWLE